MLSQLSYTPELIVMSFFSRQAAFQVSLNQQLPLGFDMFGFDMFGIRFGILSNHRLLVECFFEHLLLLRHPMRPRGFEPRTSSLSATRSNQLSYGREAHFVQPSRSQNGRASVSIRSLLSNGIFKSVSLPIRWPASDRQTSRLDFSNSLSFSQVYTPVVPVKCP